MLKSRRDFGSVVALGLVCSLALPLGCNKKERAVAAPPSGLPALGSGGGPAVHRPEGMPSDHPPVLRGMNQGGQPGAAEPTAAPAKDFLRGTLALDASVRDKVQAGATLFLAARAFNPGGGPGQVLAVKRLTTGSWPMSFELTSADVMLNGTTFQGKVVLTARVDQDGEAMTKQVGDVEGQAGPVEVPNAGVALVLNTVRTQAAGSPGGMGGGMGGGGTMGGGGMPPGHPPTGMPEGHPPTGMPPGHP